MNLQITYKEGYKYQLTKPILYETGIIPPAPVYHLYYTLDIQGGLDLFTGFAWDGATWCPEWLVPPYCSAPHDAFCQMMRVNKLPYEVYSKQVHGLLQTMVAARRGSVLAGVVYAAVTVGKGGHPNNKDDNPEVTDP